MEVYFHFSFMLSIVNPHLGGDWIWIRRHRHTCVRITRSEHAVVGFIRRTKGVVEVWIHCGLIGTDWQRGQCSEGWYAAILWDHTRAGWCGLCVVSRTWLAGSGFCSRNGDRMKETKQKKEEKDQQRIWTSTGSRRIKMPWVAPLERRSTNGDVDRKPIGDVWLRTDTPFRRRRRRRRCCYCIIYLFCFVACERLRPFRG